MIGASDEVLGGFFLFAQRTFVTVMISDFLEVGVCWKVFIADFSDEDISIDTFNCQG